MKSEGALPQQQQLIGKRNLFASNLHERWLYSGPDQSQDLKKRTMRILLGQIQISPPSLTYEFRGFNDAHQNMPMQPKLTVASERLKGVQSRVLTDSEYRENLTLNPNKQNPLVHPKSFRDGLTCFAHSIKRVLCDN